MTYLRAKTNMNQGKSDIIVKRKVQALFRNKQKYKYNKANQKKVYVSKLATD